MAVAALIVLGLSVVLSPFLVVLASLALVVSAIALLIQLLRHGSLRRWAIVAAASLVLVLLFSGMSNALYGGGQEEPATSPEPTQQVQSAPPDETTAQTETKTTDEETTAASDATTERTRPQLAAENADQAEPEREAPQPPSPEEKLAELGKVVTVSRVVDGDTIEVSPAGRVDTPNSKNEPTRVDSISKATSKATDTKDNGRTKAYFHLLETT